MEPHRLLIWVIVSRSRRRPRHAKAGDGHVLERRIWTIDLFASSRNPDESCRFIYAAPCGPTILRAVPIDVLAARELPAEQFSMIGKMLGHYRILEKIGQGRMGEVFLAEDTSLHRNVALKFLPSGMQQDLSVHKRFLREAHPAAALDHPYICSIHEVGESEGRDFIVMEYVDGPALRNRLARGHYR